MQLVWAIILQPAHFLRLTDFCWEEKGKGLFRFIQFSVGVLLLRVELSFEIFFLEAHSFIKEVSPCIWKSSANIFKKTIGSKDTVLDKCLVHHEKENQTITTNNCYTVRFFLLVKVKQLLSLFIFKCY